MAVEKVQSRRRGRPECVVTDERVLPAFRTELYALQTFETMNPNNLTAPIFKGKDVDELVLPTFHPVALVCPFWNCCTLTNKLC